MNINAVADWNPAAYALSQQDSTTSSSTKISFQDRLMEAVESAANGLNNAIPKEEQQDEDWVEELIEDLKTRQELLEESEKIYKLLAYVDRLVDLAHEQMEERIEEQLAEA